MNEELIKYAETYTAKESETLRKIAQSCYESRSDSSMLSGFYQGRVLSLLTKMIQPKVVLEIGTYLGYSALCFAEGLAPGGKVITLDVNENMHAAAVSFIEKSDYKDRIEFRLGNALEIIPQLDETLDLVFIDADKENYSNYYRLVFEKLRVGGCIIADNVLWSGKVLQAENGKEHGPNTQALHEFNRMILADKRVSNVLLPVRDGLMLIRKESD
ncbi:MAG: O-methyltransferase family 3 [Acidobacteria bacterium]|jgi:caffeoyl-CoA O-methyltransferase|nr:O-methyltransferase family 3 [Acidobacteriota bacterium]